MVHCIWPSDKVHLELISNEPSSHLEVNFLEHLDYDPKLTSQEQEFQNLSVQRT